MEQESSDSLTKAEFWMRVAGASFALWSLMIPLGVWMIGNTFERAMRSTVETSSELVQFNRRFEAYVLNMERRITIVEERQSRVIGALNDITDRVGVKPK